ncbi:MAG: SSURE domain-containing protein, partial [Lactococcus cremoris]
YAADSSGKADTSKVVATKMIQVNLTKEQNTVASQEVYRLYNKMSGEHLYTTSAYEYNTLTMTNSSWSGEKVAWKAPKTGNNVYRVYNPNSGEHLYTESSFEVNSLVKQNGWKSEGVAFHSDSNSGTPVYRLYNPNSKLGAHFLTMSSYERDSLVKAGWKSEGIAFYAIK